MDLKLFCVTIVSLSLIDRCCGDNYSVPTDEEIADLARLYDVTNCSAFEAFDESIGMFIPVGDFKKGLIADENSFTFEMFSPGTRNVGVGFAVRDYWAYQFLFGCCDANEGKGIWSGIKDRTGEVRRRYFLHPNSILRTNKINKIRIEFIYYNSKQVARIKIHVNDNEMVNYIDKEFADMKFNLVGFSSHGGKRNRFFYNCSDPSTLVEEWQDKTLTPGQIAM